MTGCMAEKKVYFFSDAHLGATYIDDPRRHEQRLVDWLMSIKDDAAEIYMLGDVLDYWYEYRTVVPRGYVRFFGTLAALADSGVKIYWFIGNHDIWLFDYLRDEIGLTVVDGYLVKDILGKRFFMSHGDGIGKLKPSFRLMRWIFRNKFCQKLYAAIHPRWTIPFAHGWSSSSRDFEHYVPLENVDPKSEPLVQWAEEYSIAHPGIDYFLFGHRHVLLRHALQSDGEVVILGDWIRHFTYACFDGQKMEICSYN